LVAVLAGKRLVEIEPWFVPHTTNMGFLAVAGCLALAAAMSKLMTETET
jgi:hypothetical protein